MRTKWALLFYMTIVGGSIFSHDEITPHKFTDAERKKGGPAYVIPSSCRYTVKRGLSDDSDIVYYFSKPKQESYPIAILCGGSVLEEDIHSIIHFHRYFLKEFLDLGIAVITVELRGVDGDKVDVRECMHHYTRSNRLQDHCTIIEQLKKFPPSGWDGTLIFLGVSEGGPLVTTITTRYADITRATINWCGIGDFSWDQELWDFIKDLKTKIPWFIKLRTKLSLWMPFSIDLSWAESKEMYQKAMQAMIDNPTSKKKLAGMTYKYHADVLKNYPAVEYEKIKTPFLAVVGDQDAIVKSADAFAEKAALVGAPITYMRVKGMDHYIRKNQSAVDASFLWLANYV